MISRTSNVSAKNFFLNSSKKIILLEVRKILLLKIAEAIALEYSKQEIINLNFICPEL
jgi:arsenate reductase